MQIMKIFLFQNATFVELKKQKKYRTNQHEQPSVVLMYKLPYEHGSNSKSFRDNGSIPDNPSQSKKNFVSQN